MAPKNNKNTKHEEMEAKVVRVCGTVTEMMYGRRTYANGRKDKEDKFRLSIKLADGEIEKFIEAAAPYYENADATYVPKFLKEDATDEDKQFLNFKSGFTFGFVQKTEDGFEDIGDFEQVLEDNGNITGSKVVVTVKLKEGAFYPVACCIVELSKKSISDYFTDCDFDDLPF